MQSGRECLPCAIRQCRKMAGLLGVDPRTEERMVGHVQDLAKGLSLDEPPSTYTSHVLLAAMDFLGSRDPFADVKREQNEAARPLAEQADRELDLTEQPLKAALMLAAAGNVIDSGPRREFRIEDALEDLRFAHDDTATLMERLAGARRVMFVLDNAGEVMFDQLVLKRLNRAELTIVARRSPILNDVTVDEARGLGLEQYGKVVGTGSRFLGVDLGTVSDQFREAYEAADVLIAKGHANFESLLGKGRDGFFVLKAKCELVASPLGVKLGESACFYGKGSRVRHRMAPARTQSKGPSERGPKNGRHLAPRTLESSNPGC